MKRNATLSGNDLRAMFTAGTDWLEKIVPDINALNVYPVPDGDCGTNMLFTMRASLAQAKHGDGPALGGTARTRGASARQGEDAAPRGKAPDRRRSTTINVWGDDRTPG